MHAIVLPILWMKKLRLSEATCIPSGPKSGRAGRERRGGKAERAAPGAVFLAAACLACEGRGAEDGLQGRKSVK